MDIFSVFTLCGGLAFFLFGMHIMSSSLEKIAGGKLELTLKKLTSNPFKSLLLGAGITIAIQSSSAMTVMLVGLVNSGIMELSQTVGLIMGSNIGTTLTAWILSMAGIEGDNLLISLLKPENFSPILALIGVILIMAAKSEKKKDTGSILCGFAILMFGMELMKDAMAPLTDMPGFDSMLTRFNNPLLGVLVGAAFTGIIQSSAASVGILQALSLTGSITYGMAIPIIMGQNIGTCVTALLSSIGTNRNARRVAAVHVSFNLIGTVICLIGFYGLNAIFRFPITGMAITPLAIAGVHSIFNIVTTLILLPFSHQLVWLANLMVPDKGDSTEKTVFLDERLMNAPILAAEQCREQVVIMGQVAKSALLDSLHLLSDYNQKLYDKVEQQEQKLDSMDDALATALVKLSARELRVEESREIFELLHVIGDFERIGDHATNLAESASELHKNGYRFSEAATNELTTLFAALTEILELTINAFQKNDDQLAGHVEPLEEVIDDLTTEIRNRHIRRLQDGECSIGTGLVLTDILTNCERVSDHCSNIGVCIIQIRNSAFEVHDYLTELKSDQSDQAPSFVKEFNQFHRKYRLEA